MSFESIPAPAPSSVDRIKEYLKETQEAHEFDISKLELSEDALRAIVAIIDLSEKARASIRNNGWGEEEHAAYQIAKGEVNDLLDSLGVESDESDEGMLAAFLRNKLMIADLIDSRYKK